MNLINCLKAEDWKNLLKEEFSKEYFHQLENKLEKEYQSKTIYPQLQNIFEAFNRTPFAKVKVVILGQDPYHGPGQAHGLCFSVQRGIKAPPSLVNIFKELESDLNLSIPNHGDLSSWADEGVLLLNSILTVEDGKPMSHKNLGWEIFTDVVIKILNEKKENLVFILWGAPAANKAKSVDEKKHLILKTVHPSPLSSYRGFFGSKPFSQANQYLISKKLSAVKWQLS